MSDEHPNIANRDWRLQAITTLVEDFRSSSGVVHKAGTPAEIRGFVKYDNEPVSIPVPNPAAIYLSLARRAGEQGADDYVWTRLLSEKI